MIPEGFLFDYQRTINCRDMILIVKEERSLTLTTRSGSHTIICVGAMIYGLLVVYMLIRKEC